MHILLINTNPVVSKLFKCFIEDKMMYLEEVVSVDKIQKKHYDIIFIDESLCKKNFQEVSQRFSFSNKVCISYDLEEIEGFDATLQKPFLPSQIMDIVDDLNFIHKKSISVLDNREIETIKSLLDMENEDIGIEEKISKKEKLKKFKKQEKNKKDITFKIKKLNKKARKRFLQGKEIKIRIQLDEEF